MRQIPYMAGKRSRNTVTAWKTETAVQRTVETLRDAKLHPEKHTDLMVKVAGYAAYFIELGDGCQDDIIHRTEHHI